ncbi:MAG: BTAD domain-containing putative transcriptional regulator, partial [Gemmatimonadota bacterium]
MLQLQTLGATDLRRDGGASLQTVLAGPKRLALLTYLTLARPRGYHRRDVLLALLWPDLDQERGRAALRTTLYHLRQTIGPEALLTRGDDELAVDRAQLNCDAVEFERLLDEGRTAAALELYQGPLLSGFYVSGVPEWEQWLENERARLATRAGTAAWGLAEDAAANGRAEEANRWAQRAFEMQRDDEGALRRLMAILDRIGDRAGAAAAFDAFARMLRAEYDSEPAPETQQLLATIRRRTVEAPVLPPISVRPMVDGSAPAPDGPRALPRRRRAFGTALVLLALGLGGYAATRARAPRLPVLAVGRIELVGVSDSLSGLPTLLGTNFARVPGIRVVSEARLAEVRAGLDDGGSANFAGAATAAGATEIIEGSLARRSQGGYRLDLRRIDLRTGATRGAFSIESTEIFDLVDLATEWAAGEYGSQVPVTRYAATLSSVMAYRLYEQGLTAYYRNDVPTASRLFRTALEEDSTFAMAAFYLSKTVDERERWALLERAERLSRSSFDRERLIIRAEWLFHMQDPARLAVAETLLVRYPTEPQSRLHYANALVGAGAFREAIPH